MKHALLNLLPPGHPWGQYLHYFDTIDSTNTRAKAMARQGAPEGTTVIAGMQTGGRGRLGRSFSSPAGLGLYLSLVLRPQCRPEQLMHLTCAAGVAAAQAVQRATGLEPGLKWTNDLVIGKRKLGGILTELSVDPETGLVDFAIIGTGINCLQKKSDFPEDIRHIACSVFTQTAQPLCPAQLAAQLIPCLWEMNAQLLFQKSAVLDAYRQRCVTLGQDIAILQAEQVRHARAVDVDENGGLLVQLPDGSMETITSGEVSIRGMYGYL